MKIVAGGSDGDNKVRVLRLEQDGDDVVVKDDNDFNIVRFTVDDGGKIYLVTEDDIDEESYDIRKGHSDINVVS